MDRRPFFRAIATTCLAALSLLTWAASARAACNLIPGTINSFDSALGATNRPYAAPGEPVDVRLRPCDSTFTPGFTLPASSYLVTVVFEPTAGGAKNAVVLTSAADCSLVNPLLGACQAQLGGGSLVTCVSGSSAGLQKVNIDGVDYLRFLFPDTDSFVDAPADDHTLAGPATIVVTDSMPSSLPCQLATTTCKGQTGLIACIDDYYANESGTCGTTVAATTFRNFTALPPPNDYQDDCFEDIPPCNANFGTPTSDLRMTTDKAGNLLAPMDWTGILVRENNVPVPRLLRSTVHTAINLVFPGQSFLSSYTPEGGLLPPIFEPQYDPNSLPGVVTAFGSADAPYTILRGARRSEVFRQCTGGANAGAPCNVAGDCPGACQGGARNGLRCGADADCPPSNTCSAVGSCDRSLCSGGSRNGLSCNSDINCPGGQCGPSLFDFGPLAIDGNGPIIVERQGALTDFCQGDTTQICSSDPVCGADAPCVAYALTAKVPVNLEGLVESSNTFAFAVKESVAGKDLNGDDSMPPYTDTVVTLTDRTTGETESLPPPVGCAIAGPAIGRSIVRQQQPPFSFPAIATEGDTIAFLESEPQENHCDLNGDRDRADSILRVFKLGPTEVTSGSNIAADGALQINSRSLAMSDGLVFFRAPEAAAAPRTTVRASEYAGGGQTISFSELGFAGARQALTTGGHEVVFAATDSGFYTTPSAAFRQIIVKNLVTGTTELISKNALGVEGNQHSDEASITADGRYVVFSSGAGNLVAGDTNTCTYPVPGVQCLDIFVYDRCVANGEPVTNCPVNPADRLELISKNTSGANGDNHSRQPQISDDGRFVSFGSASANLDELTPDTNTCSSGTEYLFGVGPCPDVFVRDRCISNGDPVPACTPSTKRVSLKSDGTEGNQEPFQIGISRDGSRVVFFTSAVLTPDDPGGNNDVYVYDRPTGQLILASRNVNGIPAAGISESPVISGDGRYVAFESTADNMVAGENNGQDDAIVRDLLLNRNEIISVAPDGSSQNAASGLPSISADGRFVLFLTGATNITPGDTDGVNDWYLRDRATGLTERVTIGTLGEQPDQTSNYASLSPDGRFAAFATGASTLIPSDTNGVQDIFVRAIDFGDTPSDTSGDGDLEDTILEVLDTSAMSPTPVKFCPASQVSVAGGKAAFLRPESEGAAPNLSLCPGTADMDGHMDLNADGDNSDQVVFLMSSLAAPATNLDRAATSVTLSAICAGGENIGKSCTTDPECPQSTCNASYVAALVSEAGEGAPLNGDGDQLDDVLEVHNLTDASTAWTNTGQAAETIKASGDIVAFLTPEAAQNAHLNSDADFTDHVLQIYDLGLGRTINTHQPAEDFVVGAATGPCGDSPLVAFRTSEAAMCGVPVSTLNCQGNNLPQGCSLNTCDLNEDGDCCDDVMQVYARGLGVINTKQAVTPCFYEACDPFVPYRVNQNKVKFITFELAQGGHDLNGNGGSGDIVLQQFEACKRVVTLEGTLDGDESNDNPLTDPHPSDPDSADSKIFVAQAGRCTQGLNVLLVPASCLIDDECPTGYTCATDVVVAAPAVVPHHDTVLQPLKGVAVTIPPGQSTVSKFIKVKVRNADILPAREVPGHTVRLSVGDGTCPVGTVAGFADFDKDTVGAQDTVALGGGKLATANVELLINAGAFTTFNRQAPKRCVLELQADADLPGNEDPTPSNNVQQLELDITDLNDTGQSSGTMNDHESVLLPPAVAKLTIPRNHSSATKTVRIKVGNGDIIPAGDSHTITLASLGGCPPGTVSIASPSVSVVGGSTGSVTVLLTASSSAFTSGNVKSPSRCVAELNVSGPMGNVEPDAANNTARLIVDVIDKND